MMRLLSGLATGLLFGIGLCISQLVDPAKVLAFLDVEGDWDPSLALVMLAAVVVTAVGYRLVFRRPKPMLAPEFALPIRSELDGTLLLGAGIFGVGWGLGGYCPGPALAGLSFAQPETLAFVAAMLVGMLIARNTGNPVASWDRLRRAKASQA